jgi:imidazolonepropionase-like amidohydrolase
MSAAPLVLKVGRLLDGTGGPPLEDTTVVIDGDRIAAIGEAPAEGIEVDLGDYTLLPGLIDAHTHLGVIDIGRQATMAPALIAAETFRNCGNALNAGFTTVRDMGGVDGGVVEAVGQGLVPGPRILPSGPILCQTGGHGDLCPPFVGTWPAGIPGLVELSLVVDGVDAMRQAARQALRRGATQLKVSVTGGVISHSDRLEDTQLSVDELRAAVEEAAARGTYVTAHAHNVAGVRNALRAGVRGIEHGSFLDADTCAEMAKLDASLVPTFTVVELMRTEWQAWGLTEEIVARLGDVHERMTEATERAMAAGVTVGSGSDLIGANQRRFGLEVTLKAAIIGPSLAIASATSVNARILGLDDRLGAIAPGFLADAVAVRGDPLAEPALFADPDRVQWVLQGGQVVKDTRKKGNRT